ncbi:hypothetical protein B0J12DRAFT_722981 [Macrophomina phaseolina]|uniref:Uncharacterized protein n=1 Tax=Macrophomina phaseolina TaxID=35725 RepID=A0ABQ8GUD3_9PEZI|nr:hypothetical protein B0J12DRAFT_722981 [Macrophomina phaseolina]
MSQAFRTCVGGCPLMILSAGLLLMSVCMTGGDVERNKEPMMQDGFGLDANAKYGGAIPKISYSVNGFVHEYYKIVLSWAPLNISTSLHIKQPQNCINRKLLLPQETTPGYSENIS